VLIANTSDFAGAARVTVLREDGDPLVTTLPLAPNSRTNVPIGLIPAFQPAINSRFGVLVESLAAAPDASPPQIVIERATYANDASGVIWSAGGSTLGTRLQ